MVLLIVDAVGQLVKYGCPNKPKQQQKQQASRTRAQQQQTSSVSLEAQIRLLQDQIISRLDGIDYKLDREAAKQGGYGD